MSDPDRLASGEAGEPPEFLAQWSEAAGRLSWDRAWTTVFEPDGPSGRWFVGGELNAAVNCVDRHAAGRGGAVAIHWEGEPGDRRRISYGELEGDVRTFAAALDRLGVGRGDRVALYMGWIPEAVVALLACARLGAVSTLVPLSLPAEALADRLAAFRAKVLVTQDGAWRHGGAVALKARADEALATLTEPGSLDATVVVRRTGTAVDWFEGDHWYDELVAQAAADTGAREPHLPPPTRAREPHLPSPTRAREPHLPPPTRPVSVPSDHPLLVQYLAGHRHQPIGVVHSTAGLLVCAAELHRRVFTGSADDVLWVAMELSFVNGIVQGIFGPLACGMPVVMFEGTLATPTWARAWEIVERYGVNTLFTTPSVVHHLRQANEGRPAHDLGSLRLVVTGGERANESDAAWLENLVQPDGPLVVNAWGQTETGGAVLFNPVPRGPGSIPDPGVSIVDGSGRAVPYGMTGEMVLRNPWPGLFLDIEGHSDVDGRYRRYWREAPLSYATGDLAIQHPNGDFEIIRRLDSVVKVSGQLVSLADIAEALGEHPLVEQAVAVQTLDADGSRFVLGCVVVTEEASPEPKLADDLRRHVHECLGGLARPGSIAFVESFPGGATNVELRHALSLVGAGRGKAESFVVSAAQLDEAIAATRSA
jgi:acetyl-CoA synthetase